MSGSSFSNPISLTVSCAINLVASVTNLTPQALMRKCILKFDLITALYPAALEVKAAKVSRERMR